MAHSAIEESVDRFTERLTQASESTRGSQPCVLLSTFVLTRENYVVGRFDCRVSVISMHDKYIAGNEARFFSTPLTLIARIAGKNRDTWPIIGDH